MNVLLAHLFFQNAKALKAKKDDGNKAFKEGNYKLAFELYTEALAIDPNNRKTNAKLYCNRGTVNSKVTALKGGIGLFLLYPRILKGFCPSSLRYGIKSQCTGGKGLRNLYLRIAVSLFFLKLMKSLLEGPFQLWSFLKA